VSEILVTLTGLGGHGGASTHVLVGAAPGLARLPAATEATTEQPDEGPSPISPELKELVWGGGAFLVFLFAMRVFLVPKMRRGMDARYASIRGGHERADAVRADAQGEVAEYEQALAAVRAEGLARVEAAGRTLEAERTERLAAANAAIAERRTAAAAEQEAARAAARDTVEAAVVDVAARAAELAVGRRPDEATLRRIAGEVLGAGVSA
jgi:F-type H+-transporting ATPase subunit b